MTQIFTLSTPDPRFNPSEPILVNGCRYAPVAKPPLYPRCAEELQAEYEAWNETGETPHSILKAAFVVVFCAGLIVGGILGVWLG